MLRLAFVGIVLLAACSAADDTPAAGEQAPAVKVGEEIGDDAFVERMKAVIRQDTVTSYAADCGGRIALPNDAFIPVEITGGGPPELAVVLARADCPLGANCPGGFGPDACRIVYEWNDQGRRLETVERRLASSFPAPPAMAYDYEDLSRRN
jgi:hypothetical protein